LPPFQDMNEGLSQARDNVAASATSIGCASNRGCRSCARCKPSRMGHCYSSIAASLVLRVWSASARRRATRAGRAATGSRRSASHGRARTPTATNFLKVTGSRRAPTERASAETADKHASPQAEAEEVFSIFWTPTVQTVPLDIEYGCGVSFELGRFTAAALQLDDRGRSLKSPPNGDAEYWMQNIECPIKWAVASRCGTDNVLNYPLGHA
jgi:hypothetical protein